MNSHWRAIQSFQENQNLISAINTLSIYTNSIYFSLILRRSGRACETRHVLIRPMKSGFVPLPDLRNNETLLIRNGIISN